MASFFSSKGHSSYGTYQMQPFCLKVNDQQICSSPLSRQLNRLPPSEKQQFLKSRLRNKVNDIHSAKHQTQNIVAMIMQLKQKEVLRLLHDDLALKHKINEALIVLKQHTSHKNTKEHNELQWKWYNIYEWIIGLKFKPLDKYIQSLYDNLKKQDIDGTCLRILNTDDWRQLGIENTDCIHYLLQKIEHLYVSSQDIMDQQAQINSLQQQVQRFQNVYTKQISTLHNALVTKSTQYDVLCKAYSELQVECEALQVKCCELDSKCMELGKQMKQKDVLHAPYEAWDCDAVCSWIRTLNDGYFTTKYKQLYHNVRVEEIDGKCLTKLDKADLHRVGITAFKDKLLLMDKISKLTAL